MRALCVVLAGLAGCSPIAAYRSMTGLSKDDPDPVTALYAQNLAAAEAKPYPNLSTVPPPPTRAMTAAERQQLTRSLIADRTATEAAVPRSSAGPTRAAAVPPLGPLVAAPAAAPRAQRAAAPGPADAALTTPSITAPLPEPEAARPPPPAPALHPMAPPPEAAPPPAAVASVQPPPPPPALTPIAPLPAAAPPPPPPAAASVATFDLTGGAPDRSEIARVAALYRARHGRERPGTATPGTVRVIAYAAPAAAGADPLASYHAALDRAQTIAGALAKAGIPAHAIRSEAAPGHAGRPGRVDIEFTR